MELHHQAPAAAVIVSSYCSGCPKHAPDSEPGTRDTGRWLVYGTELPSIREVGAVCGKAARTDLCGGREVTRVPTAKSGLTHAILLHLLTAAIGTQETVNPAARKSAYWGAAGDHVHCPFAARTVDGRG